MSRIRPHLWFDHNCEEAVNFYVSVFDDSKINSITHYPDDIEEGPMANMSGQVLHADFTLAGHRFEALDGGPLFVINPSVSFILNFDPSNDPQAEQSIQKYWNTLTDGGNVLMPFDAYPFSQKYGWVQDKFGVSWQLMLTNPDGEDRPFITPSLMFAGDNVNKAEEAIDYYVSVFHNAKRGTTAPYPQQTGPANKGSIMFADFMLEETWLAAMDSGVEHDFSFNEAVSFIVNCHDQEEVDYYWGELSAVPEAEQCGWLKDRFGISWQIIPVQLGQLMNDPDPIKSERVLQAMLQMKKIDIAGLEQAANQS